MKKTTTTTTRVTKTRNKGIVKQGKRKRQQRRNRKPRSARIPAAYGKGFKRRMHVLNQGLNSMVVTGRDMIYKIPNELVNNFDNEVNVITVIPANPAYWVGSQISSIAQSYQNYRPLSLSFTYVPMCAVTQTGNIIAGTLWDQAPSFDSLQQSLRSSNGSFQTQCFKPAKASVRLTGNLQYNLYRTGGQFDQESNPFIFTAIALGCKDQNQHDIIPGYFYVTYTFSFHNPIGQSISYYNSGLIRFGDANPTPMNKSAVLLTDGEAPIGSIIQLETNAEGEMEAYYNGSVIELLNTDLIWQFSNTTLKASNNAAEELGIAKGRTLIITTDTFVTESTVSQLYGYVTFNSNTDSYITRIYITQTLATAPAASYLITDPMKTRQQFGRLFNITNQYYEFTNLYKYTDFIVADDQVPISIHKTTPPLVLHRARTDSRYYYRQPTMCRNENVHRRRSKSPDIDLEDKK